MPMTVVVTRNVAERFRGFLASCMCEIAPGVYTSPKMSQAVRVRVWKVLEDWFKGGPDEAIVMTWPEASAPGGQAFLLLGVPKHELVEIDGLCLLKRPLTKETERLVGLGALPAEAAPAGGGDAEAG